MYAGVDRTIEAAARRDRLTVAAALIAVTVLAWVYLLGGAGMGMSALEMTRMSEQELWGGGSGGMASGSMDMQGMQPGAAAGEEAISGGDAVSGSSGMSGGAAPMGGMTDGGGMSDRGMSDRGVAGMMMQPAVWTPGYGVLMFLMWWIMMVAMMLPSAAPMILLFATVNRKQRQRGYPFVPTSVFGGAYLAAWAGFSVVAVALQWGFEQWALLSPMLVGTSDLFAALLVIAAGVYQLTPIKQACLRHCRSPLAFLTTRWRPGSRGALRMGLEHGAFCVGCCWFLMGLLFVGGVMNLYWIIGIAAFVLLEKTVPAGHWLGHATGVVLAAAGVWLLLVA